MKMLTAAALAAAILPLAPAVAAPMCNLPQRLSAPEEEGPSAREPQRVMPIGGYTLAMIWLAENCRKGGSSGAGSLDCRAGAGKGGFVLHGLWPDGVGKDWPQWCAPARPLAPATLRAHYCTTPSTQLAQHEWTKHGTCMPGYDAERYFAEARSLFAGVRMPNLRALSYRAPSRQDVQTAFAAANRGMTADMVRLNVNKQGWLEEIWVCLDRNRRWTACHMPAPKPDERVKIWRGRA
ncbi:ribonuclease T [Sphingomonas sp. AP4-R1]|uniref:ribonuclease T2 family protein n=1 Tax=Sphingomonas sp. AP4-R1 TaxID=2735134 RepID=UPI001493603C|nr:ribonuclease T [Sphingomonas sp. AP4-R1]QJU58101.1 ribonuclease T [Sphingomonas sp. AP4-R1]